MPIIQRHILRRVCYLHPLPPRPNYCFFFAFPVPLSQQSKGLETWRDAESKEVQTGSRSTAGWGEEGPGE